MILARFSLPSVLSQPHHEPQTVTLTSNRHPYIALFSAAAAHAPAPGSLDRNVEEFLAEAGEVRPARPQRAVEVAEVVQVARVLRRLTQQQTQQFLIPVSHHTRPESGPRPSNPTHRLLSLHLAGSFLALSAATVAPSRMSPRAVWNWAGRDRLGSVLIFSITCTECHPPHASNGAVPSAQLVRSAISQR